MREGGDSGIWRGAVRYLRRDPHRTAALVLAALFAAVTIAFKLTQFNSLQTQLYDLGETSNVLWNTFHGRPFWTSVMEENYLGQHFAPALALLGPLVVVTGSAGSLIVVQCLVFAAATVGVFVFARRITGSGPAGLFWALTFALSPLVHEILRVDFHEVGVGAGLTVGLLAAWEIRRPKMFWWFLVLGLLIREGYGFYLSGFGLALALARTQTPWAPPRRLAALGLGWSSLLVFAVMPFLAGGVWKPAAFAFGGGVHSAADLAGRFLTLAPWREWLGNPGRLGAVLQILAGVGALPLLSPLRAVAWILPILLNAVSANPWQQRFELHYSAAFLPYLFWGGAHGLRKVIEWARRPPLWKRRALPLAGLLLLGFNASRIPLYYHAASAARRAAARRMIDRLPPGDSVMAQTNLLAHVSLRRFVAVAPSPRPARWIFLDNLCVDQAIPELREVQAAFLERHRSYVVDEDQGLVLLHFPNVPNPSE